MTTEKVRTICISELWGGWCVSEEDGDELYGIITKHLLRDKKVSIDFTGVTGFAPPFFNGAFGPLLANHSKEELAKRLNIIGLAGTVGEELITNAINNAYLLYNDVVNGPSYAEMLAMALSRATKED